MDNIDPRRLHFLPLGGAGEFGVNMNLYGLDGKWLMIDCGIGFSDDTVPGVKVLLPDPSFIEARKKDLVGLVLTHAHEDHVGAVPHLYARLGCPIYATPFVAAFLRLKLTEEGMTHQVDLRELPLGGSFDASPFRVELVTMNHSIPEASLIVIRTDAGTVVHTGDWRFDSGPVVGVPFNRSILTDLGKDGVLAVIGDSTNADNDISPRSEAVLADHLKTLFAQFDKRIIVTCFSSNVARLRSIAKATQACGRQAALIGRSLWR
ncbi:MAG: ribonuclease J, partial [Pseudomonadota bacterium]|nr:ribonuclease J [Pseudomonadota bacterium]